MARIVNVIYLPHLVTFKAYDSSDYRCCGVCNYKVIIEDDDGRLLTASVMEDSDLSFFDINEAIRKIGDNTQNEDWFYPYERCIGTDDFDNFVNGSIEQGSKAIEAFVNTVSDLRVASITDDLRKQLENLVSEINELLNKK